MRYCKDIFKFGWLKKTAQWDILNVQLIQANYAAIRIGIAFVIQIITKLCLSCFAIHFERQLIINWQIQSAGLDFASLAKTEAKVIINGRQATYFRVITLVLSFSLLILSPQKYYWPFFRHPQELPKLSKINRMNWFWSCRLGRISGQLWASH